MKNFFDIKDLSRDDLIEIITKPIDEISLKNKSIGLLFENYSTRTRLSFTVGINQLNGNIIDIKFNELNYSRDESFEDTFTAFNCYLDGLIYRTNEHQKLHLASNFFEKPIINAMSDKSHPCQVISDLYTLYERFKTLNLNILWVGDITNVCLSFIEAANLITEINFNILSPNDIINNKKKLMSFDNIQTYTNLNDLDLSIYNCLMTDVFISMNDKDDKNKFQLLQPYQVNMNILNKLSNKSVFMHCLPAKIGSEVTEEVIKSHKSIVWHQAKNRMIAQKKLLSLIDW